MNVLEPELMWIDGRCYRIPVVDPKFCGPSYGARRDEELEGEIDSIGAGEVLDDEGLEIPKLKSTPNGRLKMVFPVSRAFLPFIIGSKGSTVKRISNNTSCTIMTPRFHEEQNITIYGSKKEQIILAWKSIFAIIKSSRKKLTATHFISIPLTGPEIKANFLTFKDEVLSSCTQRGICEDLFQDPDKLHLTVLVCTLTDNNERNLAETQFHELCESFVRPLLENHKPCILQVKGIDYMNDDPTDVKTLYANVKIVGEDGLLQELCDEINVTFEALGLVKDERTQVKIHLTLMNSKLIFIKRGDGDDKDVEAQGAHSEVDYTFDATEILRQYRDYYFGEQEFKAIHLSTRFTVDEDGYYNNDEVQQSLDLLDKILSEFDDSENGVTGDTEASEETRQGTCEGAAAAAPSESAPGSPSARDEDAPRPDKGAEVDERPREEVQVEANPDQEEEVGAVGGGVWCPVHGLGRCTRRHTRDDRYKGMSGRRAKFVLNLRPGQEEEEKELPPIPDPPPDPDPPPEEEGAAAYPPPPEEAERIISRFLPRVSPVSLSRRPGGSAGTQPRWGGEFVPSMALGNEAARNVERDENASRATQTTLPKTRHQRPYGWEVSPGQAPFRLQEPPHPTYRFGSLPYEAGLPSTRSPSPWMHKPGPLPPRTVPAAIDRHREVRRSNSGDVDSPRRLHRHYGEEDPTNFSDDSLEEPLPPPPPPPPVTRRESIAWDVPLGFQDEEALLTPGSTKVIGRRRRRSTEHSSNSSIHRIRETEDWPEPPPSEEQISPFSDSVCDSTETDEYGFPSALPLDLTFNGTYVIRKGRRKERSPVKNSSFETIRANAATPVTYERRPGVEPPKRPDLKRASSTFENIKLFLKEGMIEGINEAPPDFQPPNPQQLVRVVSLPTLPTDEQEPEGHHRGSKCERYSKLNELEVTLEEAEDELSSLDNPSLNTYQGNLCCGLGELRRQQRPRGSHTTSRGSEIETQTDLSDMEPQNELEIVGNQLREMTQTKSELEEVEKKIQEIVKIKTVLEREERAEFSDPWIKACGYQQAQAAALIDEKPPGDFDVNVEILQHDFGPLPPSPDDEDGDEYSEIFHPSPAQTPKGRADTLPEPFYRCHEPRGSDPSGRYLNRAPEPVPHRASDPVSSSLKTRSMDAGFSRAPRVCCNGSRRETGSERRTLPPEFPGAVTRRRTFQKRSSTSPQESMQTSCSLPETPIFTRVCDIARTPRRRNPESHRPGIMQSSSYRRNAPGPSPCSAGVGMAGVGMAGVGMAGVGMPGVGLPGVGLAGISMTGGLNQAMAGAELLRLSGGPGRGWYPRHRQHRPASIEHLDRLPHSGSSPGNGVHNPWDISSRKPMTLPPNMSPKFFHRSPREALRRVTSLLIRGRGSRESRESRETRETRESRGSRETRESRGSRESRESRETRETRESRGSRESRKESPPVPTSRFGEASEQPRRRKGFFRNFWKRSRHYSLDNQ